MLCVERGILNFSGRTIDGKYYERVSRTTGLSLLSRSGPINVVSHWFKTNMEEREIIRYYSSKSLESLQGLTVGLIGELGAGKTHLVKKIVGELIKTATTPVQSPTFNICNIYTLNKGLTIHHYDLYRIEEEEDLFNIGIWESMGSTDLLTFIEWVNLYPEINNRCDEVIGISILPNETRLYDFRQDRV